eukprot:GILJ01004022.1.p1 GENE.GILJ01004022.1~~GILJ01004022.1.p1  ORF type:complete len:512 (+),score=66.29 GILJ01004022.1:191-1726(+)
MRIKSTYEDQVRRFNEPDTVCFQELASRVRELYHIAQDVKRVHFVGSVELTDEPLTIRNDDELRAFMATVADRFSARDQGEAPAEIEPLIRLTVVANTSSEEEGSDHSWDMVTDAYASPEVPCVSLSPSPVCSHDSNSPLETSAAPTNAPLTVPSPQPTNTDDTVCPDEQVEANLDVPYYPVLDNVPSAIDFLPDSEVTPIEFSGQVNEQNRDEVPPAEATYSAATTPVQGSSCPLAASGQLLSSRLWLLGVLLPVILAVWWARGPSVPASAATTRCSMPAIDQKSLAYIKDRTKQAATAYRKCSQAAINVAEHSACYNQHMSAHWNMCEQSPSWVLEVDKARQAAAVDFIQSVRRMDEKQQEEMKTLKNSVHFYEQASKSARMELGKCQTGLKVDNAQREEKLAKMERVYRDKVSMLVEENKHLQRANERLQEKLAEVQSQYEKLSSSKHHSCMQEVSRAIRDVKERVRAQIEKLQRRFGLDKVDLHKWTGRVLDEVNSMTDRIYKWVNQ